MRGGVVDADEAPRWHAPAPLARSVRAELKHVASQADDHLVQVPHRTVDPGPQGRVVGEGGRLQPQPDREHRLY